MPDQPKTTGLDLAKWLCEQGQERPDDCIQQRDWCSNMNAAALEIERLRAERDKFAKAWESVSDRYETLLNQLGATDAG